MHTISISGTQVEAVSVLDHIVTVNLKFLCLWKVKPKISMSKTSPTAQNLLAPGTILQELNLVCFFRSKGRFSL